MPFLEFSEGNPPTFQEWLIRKTGKTSKELMTIALATGSWKEAQGMMHWYRERYRMEMRLRELYLNNNLFKEDMEDDRN